MHRLLGALDIPEGGTVSVSNMGNVSEGILDTPCLNFWRPFSILLGELSWALANASCAYCFEP